MHTIIIRNNQSRFTQSLDQTLREVSSVTVSDVQIPNSFYNIVDGENTLIITVNSINYTLTVPIGNYNASTLLTELKRLLDLQVSNDVNFNFNTTTGKCIISSPTVNVSIQTVSPLTRNIGFLNISATGTQSITSDSVIDLVTSSVYILLENIKINAQLNEDRYNILYKGVMSVPPFFLFTDLNRDGIVHQLDDPININRLQFRIVDQNLNDINFNGAYFEFSVIFNTNEN